MGGNTQPFNQKQVPQTSQGQKSYYGQQPKTSTSTKGRAQSHGQNLITSGSNQNKQAKPKDAYTLIQEQQRAEQAKQPQNQFEHQEQILRQLNSDEVFEKLMKIFNEREALYAQMEKENRHSGSNRISMSANAKSSGHPKNQSAGPAIRGHQLSSG